MKPQILVNVAYEILGGLLAVLSMLYAIVPPLAQTVDDEFTLMWQQERDRGMREWYALSVGHFRRWRQIWTEGLR